MPENRRPSRPQQGGQRGGPKASAPRSGSKPPARSGGKPTGKPTGKSSGKPTGKSSGKPAGTSSGKPVRDGAGHSSGPRRNGRTDRPARSGDWKRPASRRDDDQAPRTRDQQEYDGPDLPENITGAELDRSVSSQLKGLPEKLASRVARHLAAYKDFPPRQKPGSFSLDQVLAKLHEHGGGAR